MSSSKTIEVSSLQTTLQKVYMRVQVYIVVWTSLLCLLFVAKSLLIYFLVPVEGVPLSTFLMAPENNSVQDTPLGSFYDTILSLMSMMFSFALMMIASKAEKLYIEGLATMPEPPAFLFSLEIDVLPNVNSARFLASIFETLQSREAQPQEWSLVQDAVCVFDMENYFDAQGERRFLGFRRQSTEKTPLKAKEAPLSRESNSRENKGSEKAKGSRKKSVSGKGDFAQKNEHSRSEAQSVTREHREARVQGTQDQLIRLHSVPDLKFNGKMILVLRELEVVYDILNLFHCGLFQTKIQSDVDSAFEIGALNFRKDLMLEALNKADKNALFENLNIRLAQDAHDIIWSHFAKSERARSRELWCRVCVCLAISCLVSLLVAVIYYLSTAEFLHIVLVDDSEALSFSIGELTIRTNWKILVATLSILVLPLMGSVLVEVLAEYVQCSFFSDYNNLRFRLEILFEFIHRYVFLHWAFTLAVLRFRDSVEQALLPRLYGYAYFEWNKTAFFLIPTTLLRYLTKYLKNCFSRCANKATPEKVLFSVDFSVSSVNVLLTFMYLGFYFPVLSLSVVTLLMVNILVNFLLFMILHRSTTVLQEYLSYTNVASLINHCLVAFNVGGLLSIFIFATYSSPYFGRLEEYSGALPSNFIGSIFMLFFAFINYMTNKPNSLYLRVLQNLLPVPLYKDVTPATLKEALKSCDYRKKNPFYKELSRLQSVRASQRDAGPSSSSKEGNRLPMLDRSFDRLFDFGNQSPAQESWRQDKFTDMPRFGQDLLDLDRGSE